MVFSADSVVVIIVMFVVILFGAMLSVTLRGLWRGWRDRRARIKAAWSKRFGVVR